MELSLDGRTGVSEDLVSQNENTKTAKVIHFALPADILLAFLGFMPPMLLNIRTEPYPRDWALAVFNPLRNRVPERVAESFLERLRLVSMRRQYWRYKLARRYGDRLLRANLGLHLLVGG